MHEEQKQPASREHDLSRYVYSENTIHAEEDASVAPKKNKLLKLAIFVAIFIGLGLTFFSGRPNSTSKEGNMGWFNGLSFMGQLKNLAISSDRMLKGEERDRVNILLLGMGGKNHDGGYLTDTIMLLSLQPSTKKVSMISVPRDLTVPIEGYGWRKVNNINAFAEKENPGSGGVAVSQSLSELLDTPIDYYLRVDFAGFEKVIDELGGVEVQVENTLDDYRYPVRGQEDNPSYSARYEHLHVEPGLRKMDGSLALKFARSRHAYGAEGSDFARAKRQQLIIEAVKNRLLSMHVLFKPSMISGLISTYNENVSTNLQVWEMVKLWDLFKNTKKDEIVNKVLDNGPGGLLVNRTGEDGAYLLVPRAGDFSQIKYLVANVFAEAPTESKHKIEAEQSKIEIMNGTWINGLASRTSLDLESLGFKVISTSNASQRNFERSVIYDMTNNDKPESLELLKNKTDANVAFELPEWLKTELEQERVNGKTTEKPDFILVLGQQADKTGSGAQNKSE